MGNVEKWVVLGVLGLIVGILVVSLTVDDPLKTEGAVLAAGAAAPETGAPATDPAGGTPSTLLSAGVESTSSGSAQDPASDPRPGAEPVATATPVPPGSILRSMDGLQPSYMNDMMFYTWKAGDTFPTLAQRFYGDVARLATLRRVNEGRTDVEPGDRILVPVYDLDGGSASPAPKTAGAVQPASDAAVPSGPATPGTGAAQPAGAAESGPRVHVVQEGESLWRIAKKELGAGSRWKEIYDANRDQMSSPEALHAGQKLRLP